MRGDRWPVARVRAVGLMLAAGLVTVLPAAASGSGNPSNPHEVKSRLQKYETDYYVIHTDLDIETVREVAARMRAMAEEYHRRTKGFAGNIDRKLPFYLFSSREDYYAAGGPKDTSGVYKGGSLLAVASGGSTDRFARVVQHEAFHQFAQIVITPRLPVWVNEGLAEYFAEGIWTGDGLVTGVISPSRLLQIQKSVKDNELLPFPEMLKIDQDGWNKKAGTTEFTRNYAQAWSMVHFLVHGDDGKYRQAFSDFIGDISRAKAVQQAFTDRFGRDIAAFEKRYRQWWAGMDENPTADLYTQATVATLTSFLARGTVMGLNFKTADEFLTAANDGKPAIDGKTYPKLWLPASLLTKALRQSAGLKEWSLQVPEPVAPKPGQTPAKVYPKLVLRQPDGKTFVGAFTLPSGKSPEVTVTIEAPKPATRP